MTGERYARAMTTATRSVAVVATRLPDIDRRALSQAWFSALHLAQPPAAKPIANPLPAASHNAAGRAKQAAPDAAAPAAAPTVRVHAGAAATGFGSPPVERRKPGGELACRIERAIVRHAARAPHRTAAVAIDAGYGRVHLLVRTDHTTTRIVALCSPQMRERVDRALAHARFTLAACGLQLESAR